MKFALFLFTAISPLTAMAAEDKCSDTEINQILERANKISSVEYESAILQREINEAQADLKNCETVIGLGATYPARTKLYCRAQYENQHSAVGCENAGFDGGDLMHYKNNDDNEPDEK